MDAYTEANAYLEQLGDLLDTEDENRRQKITDLQSDLEFRVKSGEDHLENRGSRSVPVTARGEDPGGRRRRKW